MRSVAGCLMALGLLFETSILSGLHAVRRLRVSLYFFFEMRWIFAFFNTKAVQLDRQYSFVLVHLLAFKMDKHLTIFD